MGVWKNGRFYGDPVKPKKPALKPEPVKANEDGTIEVKFEPVKPTRACVSDVLPVWVGWLPQVEEPPSGEGEKVLIDFPDQPEDTFQLPLPEKPKPRRRRTRGGQSYSHKE